VTVTSPTTASQKAEKKPRQMRSRSERRLQLIDATIRCIAQHGLSATTMQLVTREAGLSLGIANLHFQSKENLLAETLRHVTREYNDGLLAILTPENSSSDGCLADTLERPTRLSVEPWRHPAAKDGGVVCLLWGG
jgi:AcrR family transcriptional regulator